MLLANFMLALALVVSPGAPVVSPSPAPSVLPKGLCPGLLPGLVKYCGVEIEYANLNSGPETYLDFARPLGTQAFPISGRIFGYDLRNQHTTPYPFAALDFMRGGASDHESIVLAYPLRIDGVLYECVPPLDASPLVRLHKLCPSLPAALLKPSQYVTVWAYPYVLGSSGVTWLVTGDIRTIRP